MLTIMADLAGVFCILFWGWWLCRRLQIPGSFGPVLGTALCMVVLQALGGLWYGVLLLFIGAVYSATRGHRRAWAVYMASPGVLAFLAGFVVIEIAFSLRLPRMQTWDEFSHWGVFFKNIFYEHRFAIWENGRSLAHPSYPQGGAALYGLFSLLRGSYTERDVFLAMDIPLLAAGAALFGAAKPAGRRPCAVYRLLAMAAVPFLFGIFAPDTPYTTVYMDAAVGALFAAGLVFLFTGAGSTRAKGWAVGLLSAATATLKEIGTVFALCLLGVWLVQCLLEALRQAAPRRWRLDWRGFCTAFLPAGLVAGGSIALWKVMLLATHNTDDQFSSMGAGHFFKLWEEARTGTDPYFYDVWHAFYAKMRTEPLLFGWSTLKLGAACLAASLVLAALLYRFAGQVSRRRGGQLAAVPLLTAGYFPCYLFVLFYVYIGGMSSFEALKVASYSRYACCFFIGWFGMLAGGVLILCRFLPRPRLRGGVALAAAGALAAISMGRLAVAGLANGYSLPYEDWRDEQIATAAALQEAIQDDTGAIWLLSADPDTAYQTMWYYQYELYPSPVCIEVPGSQAEVDLAYNFAEHSIRYLVLFGVTEDFVSRYADWASDGFAAARVASPTVYRVENAAGSWKLTPAS